MTATTEQSTPVLPPPPGPRLPLALQTLIFGSYRHRWLPRLRRRYGDTFLIRMAPHTRQLVILSRVADIRAVFGGSTATFHAGEGNAILGPVMGQHSVLLLDEGEHLRIRQLLMPAFHGAALRGYQDLIAEIARAEVDSWPVDRVFGMHERMRALTLEIILQVVFGVTDQSRLAELRPVVSRAVNVGPVIMLGWFYPRLRRFRPWSSFIGIQQSLDRLLYAEIAERRDAPHLAVRTDVLSRLLRTRGAPERDGTDSGLTDRELRDNLITLLLAGHETTATVLAWAFAELARDGQLLSSAQRAADTAESPESGDYIEALAKESMRLHPVLYEVARRLTEPLEVNGFRIPAGATVMPAIGLVHADPLLHRAPDRFDPSRFIGTQPAPNTWIPFGGGARRCLGAGFSLLEARVVLAEVLRRFDVSADRERQEQPKARNITLAPGRGARVRLSPRRP